MAGIEMSNVNRTTKETTECSVKSSQMEQELLSLKNQFRGQLRILPGRPQGLYPTTVKLNPEGLDIVFNFKLTALYPEEPPKVVVRSEALSEKDIYEMTEFMNQVAEKRKERGSILEMVDTGLQWLKEGQISLKGGPAKKSSNVIEGYVGKRDKKKGKNHKRKGQEEKEVQKKPPMKTAMDVVKRILWDAELERDKFLIGYLDRIDGLKEKYFTAFSWEDIASVDYNVLAIPKHRIQYFKYQGEIVWDKRCRLDKVFGSAGSKETITDIIKQLDFPQNQNNEELDAQGEATPERVSDHEGRTYGSWSESDCTDSDSDDDGITVTLGNECDDDHDDNDDDNGFNKYWRDRLRPNYFLALRMDNEDIRQAVKTIQDDIVLQEPRLAQCCIPPEALHITLCTIGLDTVEQVANAVQCLQEAKLELASFVPKDKPLIVSGVDNFFHRVLYAKVEFPQEFVDFVEHLKLCLNEQGIDIRDYHDFVPHMTLMKISRPVARATGKKYISPWLYSSYNSTHFGSQSVDNLSLCEMGDGRQDDGFYMTATALQI